MGILAKVLGQNRAVRGVSKDRILIGNIAPMSGVQEIFGRLIRLGLDLCFEPINAQGGIHGRRVEIVQLDDRWDAMVSVEKAKELIEQHEVFALISQLGTPSSIATQPYLTEMNVPMIGPINGSDSLRIPPIRNVFNVRASFTPEIREMARFSKRNLKAKSVALLRTIEGTGHTAKQAATKELKDVGIEFLGEALVSGTTLTDLESAAKKIEMLKPEVVISYAPSAVAGELLRIIRKNGVTAHVVHGAPCFTPALFEKAGAAAEGAYFALNVPLGFEDRYPIARQFGDLMRQLNRPISLHAFEAYLGANLFVEAALRAGPDLSQESLYAALESMGGTDIGGWRVSLSPENHTANEEIHFAQWKGGKLNSIY